MRNASASIETPLGLVSSSWAVNAKDVVMLTVVIPPNATAEVWVPGDSVPRHIGSGRHVFKGHVENIEKAE